MASNLLALLLGILKTVGRHADIVCEIEIFQAGIQSSLYPPRGAICGPTDRGQSHQEQEQRERIVTVKVDVGEDGSVTALLTRHVNPSLNYFITLCLN